MRIVVADWRKPIVWLIAFVFAAVFASCFAGCALPAKSQEASSASSAKSAEFAEVGDKSASAEVPVVAPPDPISSSAQSSKESASADELREALGIVEDYRPSFSHGTKTAEFQKYIVLHDTEGEGDPGGVISWWDSNGNLVAAHFIVDKDGTIWQCVPMDDIAHHAGFGDAGHNAYYGVEDESRDDKLGTQPIGDWAPDYGMNSYSIGIEMVHVGGSGYYPEEQLEAIDRLIAYIDAYYGFESEIIDHKAWRSGNSDTSPEFSEYLWNYQDHRTHD